MHSPYSINPSARDRAFTLVELLVVISVIAILASLIMGSAVNAKERARRANCMNNLRQFIIATQMYADENGGYLPSGGSDHPDPHDNHIPVVGSNTWHALIRAAGIRLAIT